MAKTFIVYSALSLLLVFSTTSCSTLSYLPDDDPWLAKDKMYHFVAAGAIGAGSTALAAKNGDDDVSPYIGVSVAMAFGAGKEYYDENVKGTFWSWKDMVWDFIGGTTGSYIYYSHKKRR
jgi:uncharacterized protein YfiM (DUF2279 family)